MKTNFLKGLGVFTICLGLLGLPQAHAVTLYDNLVDHPETRGADFACPVGSGECLGPLFASFSTGSSSFSAATLDVTLRLAADPLNGPGTFTVSLWTSDDSGATPVPLAQLPGQQVTSNISSLPTDPFDFHYAFTAVPLDANTRYWVGLSADTDGLLWYYLISSYPENDPTNFVGVSGQYANFAGQSFANGDSYQMRVEVTPVPGTLSLFAGGLGVISLVARRRRRKMRAEFQSN